MAFSAFWLHKSSPPSLTLKRTYFLYINTRLGGEDNIIAEGIRKESFLNWTCQFFNIMTNKQCCFEKMFVLILGKTKKPNDQLGT